MKAVSDAIDFELPPLQRFVTAEGSSTHARFRVCGGCVPGFGPASARLAKIARRLRASSAKFWPRGKRGSVRDCRVEASSCPAIVIS